MQTLGGSMEKGWGDGGAATGNGTISGTAYQVLLISDCDIAGDGLRELCSIKTRCFCAFKCHLGCMRVSDPYWSLETGR